MSSKLLRAVAAAGLISPGAFAHVISMSNGELRISGRSATYELRMPGYEIEQVGNPETALLDEIRFAGARRVSSECKREKGTFVCNAQYEFDHDVTDKVDVECTLYRITVPNHIHLLYAVNGENGDQQVFDQTKTSAEMRFHPPSLVETIGRDGLAGVLRLLSSFSALLFLVALGLAARSAREAVVLSAGFLAGEWVVRTIAPFVPVALSPEFLEAVLALTVAYLAGEIIFLPESRTRWAVVPVLGLIHGLTLAPFPPLYLGAAAIAQALILAGLCAGALRTPAAWRRRIAGGLLLVAGVWFAKFVI